jgi:RNAse (barnase) inhibitor barstar
MAQQIPAISLDASDWKTPDDFYTSFFQAVGAPEWHGRNLDALNDSIATGSINQIEVPYRIVIQNTAKATASVNSFLKRFNSLVKNCMANGCPVDIALE